MKMRNSTLCFVRYKDMILMINRNKKPFMGMWNAVGGHIEENEAILDCAKREIFEESNIIVDNIINVSKFTWNYDDETTFVCLASLEDNFDISSFPFKSDEGIIDFKPISWIIDKNNFGVIPDLVLFINDIANNSYCDYHLVYDDSKLIEVIEKTTRISF